MVFLQLDHISKRFGEFEVLKDVSFSLGKGKFLTLLGPSGSGKTTTLRIIAGFSYPDSGYIMVNNKIINDLPPNKRNIGMVFQNYALFPHMTVEENVGFGLKMRHLSEQEIKERVKSVLRMVELEGLEKRKPKELSGGQQQRVALARALVVEPDILLLDEPLSNLDQKLRISMRYELKRIQKNVGITAVYVTHDQEEALVLSDVIAVMNKGQILQIGQPREIYERPKNAFVAEFIGITNALKGKINRIGDYGLEIKLNNSQILTVKTYTDKLGNSMSQNSDVQIYIRADFISLEHQVPKIERLINVLEAYVIEIYYHGSYIEYLLDTNGVILRTRIKEKEPKFQIGQKCYIVIYPEDIMVFSAYENE